LLGEVTDEQFETSGADAESLEVLELRDTARRLRAAVQWVPLPAGRNAVRRALL